MTSKNDRNGYRHPARKSLLTPKTSKNNRTGYKHPGRRDYYLQQTVEMLNHDGHLYFFYENNYIP